MTHEEFQSDLPAYVAGRLSAPEVARLQHHLSACSACQALAAAWVPLTATARDGSIDLFEPHPESLDLRDLALGLRGEEEALRHHVRTCAPCGLEVQAWQAWESKPASRRGQPEETASRARVPMLCGLSAAAGIVLGLGLSLLAWRPLDGPRSPVQEEPWAGPTAQIVLPAALRDAAPSTKGHTIEGGERRVVISFPPADGSFSRDEEPYRFVITGSAGEVFSQVLTGKGARRHLEGAGVVTFDLLSEQLPPDRYECRITDGGGAVLYRTVLEISGGH